MRELIAFVGARRYRIKPMPTPKHVSPLRSLTLYVPQRPSVASLEYSQLCAARALEAIEFIILLKVKLL
jgi:hypothetical protein